jgi:septum formation topological specificity factor MinE
MTANELENDLIAGRATLNELLERIRTHIQARDEKLYEVNKLVSIVKDRKEVSIDNFSQLRKEINSLIVEYTKINEISSYIKGFTACYDQVEPLMQDIASISLMIEQQKEQLRALSASVMSPNLAESINQHVEE